MNVHQNASQTAPPDYKLILIQFLARAWIIILCSLLAGLAGLYYFMRSPKVFSSTATIQVEQEEQRVLKIEQIIKEDLRSQEVMNTIAQKLTSRPLLERVVASNQIYAPQVAGENSPPSGPPQKLSAGALSGMIKVALRRNTRLIDITVKHTEAKATAIIANSLVEQYLNLENKDRSSTTRGAAQFLNEEATRLGKKLEISEQALQSFREEVGLVSLRDSQEMTLAQLRELRQRLAQAQAEGIKTKIGYEQARTMKDDTDKLLNIPVVSADPGVIAAATTLAKLENEFTLVQQRYKEKHPQYLLAKGQLSDAKTTLIESARAALATQAILYENSCETIKEISRVLREAEESAVKLEHQAVKFNLLTREVESDRALFDSVLNRLKETGMTTELQSEKIRMIQSADIPTATTSPSLLLIVMASACTGIIMGCGIILGINFFDTALKTVDAAEQYLQLPVLCTVPNMRKVLKKQNTFLLTGDTSPLGMEAFRMLRTTLTLDSHPDHSKVMMVTSSLPAEGKTFTSLNLATSLAKLGHKTLLLDFDFHQASLSQVLSGKARHSNAGAADVILGRCRLEEAVKQVELVDNLFFMSSGTDLKDKSLVLAPGKAEMMINSALPQFEYIIIDTAPILAACDTLRFASMAQKVIFVVDAEKTGRQMVMRSINQLQMSEAKVQGVVLNKFHSLYTQLNYSGNYYTK